MLLERGAVPFGGGGLYHSCYSVIHLFTCTCLLFFRACFYFLLLFEDGDLGGLTVRNGFGFFYFIPTIVYEREGGWQDGGPGCR